MCREHARAGTQCGEFEVPVGLAAASGGTSNSGPHWQTQFAGAPFASEVRIEAAADGCEVRNRSTRGTNLLLPGLSRRSRFQGQTLQRVRFAAARSPSCAARADA